MTDEEMADKFAEDYVMREDVITENDRVPFDNGYGFQTVDFEKEVKKGYKDGFLAGTRENGERLEQAKEIIRELNEGLDKLYLSGLSVKQIAFVEQLQDKAEQFLREIEK